MQVQDRTQIVLPPAILYIPTSLEGRSIQDAGEEVLVPFAWPYVGLHSLRYTLNITVSVFSNN